MNPRGSGFNKDMGKAIQGPWTNLSNVWTNRAVGGENQCFGPESSRRVEVSRTGQIQPVEFEVIIKLNPA